MVSCAMRPKGPLKGMWSRPAYRIFSLHHVPDEWFQNEAKQESLMSVGLADQLDVPFGVGT